MLETQCFVTLHVCLERPREPRTRRTFSPREQVDRLAAQMSLEAAAKELEKLEMQMHKRESNVSARGPLEWVRNRLPH